MKKLWKQIKNFGKHIVIASNTPRLSYYLGCIHAINNEFPEAIKCFKKEIKNNSTHVESYYNLAIIYEKLEEDKKAIKYLRKAKKISPDKFEINYELGYLYYIQNDLEQAKQCMEIVLKQDSNNIFANLVYGIFYKINNEFKTALKYLEKVIKLEPDDVQAHIELSKLYMMKEEYNKAIKHSKKALKIMPDVRDALKIAGFAYFAKNEFDIAIDYLEKYRKKQPGDLEALIKLFNAYDQLNDFDKAEFVLEVANENDLLATDYYYALGYLCGKRGDLPSAIEFLEKAIEIDSENANAKNFLAEVKKNVALKNDNNKHWKWLNDSLLSMPVSHTVSNDELKYIKKAKRNNQMKTADLSSVENMKTAVFEEIGKSNPDKIYGPMINYGGWLESKKYIIPYEYYTLGYIKNGQIIKEADYLGFYVILNPRLNLHLNEFDLNQKIIFEGINKIDKSNFIELCNKKVLCNNGILFVDTKNALAEFGKWLLNLFIILNILKIPMGLIEDSSVIILSVFQYTFEEMKIYDVHIPPSLEIKNNDLFTSFNPFLICGKKINESDLPIIDLSIEESKIIIDECNRIYKGIIRSEFLMSTMVHEYLARGINIYNKRQGQFELSFMNTFIFIEAMIRKFYRYHEKSVPEDENNFKKGLEDHKARKMSKELAKVNVYSKDINKKFQKLYNKRNKLFHANITEGENITNEDAIDCLRTAITLFRIETGIDQINFHSFIEDLQDKLVKDTEIFGLHIRI